MFRRGRVHVLAVVAFLLGSVLLLGCQPAQPVPLGTPKPAEKAAEKAGTTAAPAPTKPAAQAAQKPVRGGTLRIANASEFGSLDPNTITAQAGMFALYENLIEPDKGGSPTKVGLAKDWSVSSDGKSITFKLRQGVKFHDGTDFNAEAVKFNIERMRDPASKSPFREYYAAVASVEVVDNLTVRFNLSRPDVLILARMTDAVGGMMVSPAAVKKYGVDFPRNPVGTGPFQFVEWKAGDSVTVKRFEGYWKKDQDGNQLPYLDRVVFQLIADPSTSVANLRTGQIDLSSKVPVEQIPLVKNDPNLTYESRPSLTTQGLAMNTKRDPFDNKALRQAVALALDREGMARVAGGTAWASIISPLDRAYDDGKARSPARDVVKAKAKMAEAGYPAGGLKVKYTTTNDPLNMNLAQVSKVNLAEIGIEAEIEAFAFAAWNTKVRTDFAYQMTSGVGSGMNPTVGDPGHYLANQLHSRGSRNFFGPYSNAQVDQALDKALETYDQKERAALYNEAAKVIVEDVPFVPFFVDDGFLFWNKKVRNFIRDWDSYQHTWDMWLAQ